MNQQPSEAQSAARPKPASWLDLVFYLAGGFGLLLLASIGVGFLFTELSILLSLLLYLLNFLFLAGTVYVLGVRRGRITWREMGFLPPTVTWQWLLAALGLSFILTPLRAVVGYAVQLLIGGGMEGLQARLDVFSAGGGFSWISFLLTLVGVGLLAPISEELYFRGLLHGWFRSRCGFWLRVLLSSALFSLAHFDAPTVVASSFVLGVVNAVLYELSESIWVPIAMHVITNSTAIIMLYLLMAARQFLPGLGG